MRFSSKKVLSLLVLMILLLIQTYSAVLTAPGTPGDPTTCQAATGYILVQAVASAPDGITAATGKTEKCLPVASIVLDATFYLDDSASPTGYCNDMITFSPTELANQTKACIPVIQNKINGICTRISAGNYKCLCSDTVYKY